MRTLRAIVIGVALPIQLPGPAYTQAAATPGPCVRGTLPHGALSLICVPSSGWTGDLLLWAPGYRAVSEPVALPNLVLAGGISLPFLVQSQGIAFATTSYRTNGLAVLEGMEDIRELIAAFPAVAGGGPARAYLAGASEGGLVAALLADAQPPLVDGVLPACAPIGGFRAQINHFGDARVLFDFFFPDVIPGSPIDISPEVMDHWEDGFAPAVRGAMAADPDATMEFALVAGLPADGAGATSIAQRAIDVLWYNVFATNDAASKLGGNPYDNSERNYRGSADDEGLNRGVQRFSAGEAALAALAAYETTANPPIPLVAIHTTGDPVVPFWQALEYTARASATSGPDPVLLPVQRDGHCNVTIQEALSALDRLVGRPPAPAEATSSP